MIIDNTFTALYLLYKVGCACATLAFFSLILFLIIIILSEFNAEDDKAWYERWKNWLAGFAACLFLFACGCSITPNQEEVKAYAIYAISRDAANSETAQRLTEAALNWIEGTAETVTKKQD